MTEVTTAWDNWLGEFKWTHVETLTFRQPCTQQSARRALARHLRDLHHRAHCQVPSFWVMEKTHQGRNHIHALIDAPLSSDEIRRSWQAGRAKVQQYDPTRRWRRYMTKRIGNGAVDWDITPPRS